MSLISAKRKISEVQASEGDVESPHREGGHKMRREDDEDGDGMRQRSPSSGECPSFGPTDSKDLSELVGSRSEMDFCAAYAKSAVKSFKDPEISASLKELRSKHSNSISEFFNDYLPAAQKILMPVAQKCGFEESSEGCAYFVEHIKQYSAKPEASHDMRQDVEFLCDIFVYRPANLRPASAAGSVGLQVDDQEKPGDSPPSSSEAEV